MPSVADVPGEAAAWLIRLEGQTSPEIWDEFQAWLDADRRHQAAFIRLRTAWTHCDRFKQLRPNDGRVDRNLLAGGENLADLTGSPAAESAADEAAELQHAMDRRRWLMYVGATAAATAGVGMLGWLSGEHRRWTYFETDVGGNRKAVLADRSEVLLNTDSRLRVRLGNGRRDSELIRGEAYFNVAHDKLRPFYVKAAHTLVCAMGTAFSIRIHEDRSVQVLVADGHPAIGATDPGSGAEPTLPDSAPQASGGDSVELGANSVVIKQQPRGYVTRKLAWTTGSISFDGESLTEAVREFNRYNRRHLVIIDPAIAQMKVGGSFEAQDPESFAATLEKHFGVRRMPAVRGESDVIRLASSDRRTEPRS